MRNNHNMVDINSNNIHHKATNNKATRHKAIHLKATPHSKGMEAAMEVVMEAVISSRGHRRVVVVD